MRRHTALATAALAAAGAMLWNTGAIAAEASLKMVSMLPKKHVIGKAFNVYVQGNNDEFKGRFQIDWRGGPEVVPQFKQPQAVRLGSVAMTITSPSYANGILSVSGAANYSNKTYEEILQTGYLDYMAELHAQKGLIYLAELPVTELRFHIYTRKPITRIADLENMKVRVFPALKPAIEVLGASPLVLPMGEIYTAMERGIIDGFAQGASGVGKRFTGVAAGYLVPGMYRATFHVLANPKAWAKLPRDLQADVRSYARGAGAKTFEKAWAEPLERSYRQLAESDIKPMRLSSAEEQKYKRMVLEAAWDSVKKKAPAEGAKLQSMLMK